MSRVDLNDLDDAERRVDLINLVDAELEDALESAAADSPAALQLKVSVALALEKWDALMKILSTYPGQARKENRYLWWQISFEAMLCGRCDVIEFLIRGGWLVDLEVLLHDAISFDERSLKAVDWLCSRGAGGTITDFGYWEVYGMEDYHITTYSILLEHNVVTPSMLLCEEGDLVENGIQQQQQQQPLVLVLGVTGDRCWRRRTRFKGAWYVCDTNHVDMPGLVELYARNGAPITVWPSLLKWLPEACGPRVSALMAAALRPASLQGLCRKAIRGAGPKKHFKRWVTEGLGLPGPLSDYVCSSEA